MENKEVDEKQYALPAGDAEHAIIETVNVSGHVQELDRNFGLWSICSIGILADNAWAAGGGSLVCPPE